jgi:hypothetical protein
MLDGHSPNELEVEKSGYHGYVVEVSDERVDFHAITVHHHEVTSLQLAEAVGKHPPDEFAVLRRLESLELDSVGAKEPVALHRDRPNQFFIIRGSVLYRFIADGLSFLWPEELISARTLKRLLNKDEDDIEFLIRDHHGERVLGDREQVRLSEPGLEHFLSRRVHHPIVIFVDGEEYSPPRREMTPNEIIRLAAEKDSVTNYLSQITSQGQVSYQGKGDTPIKLHNHERFQVIATGPTPVSDSQLRTGVDVFMEGLRTLSYEPRQVLDYPNCAMFDYKIETGSYAGQGVRLGFIVPTDFPMSPPSGPHVSPDIHPLNPADRTHPKGGISREQSAPFNEKAGGIWQYWSRLFPDWSKSKRNVAAYMGHIWKLWDSQ